MIVIVDKLLLECDKGASSCKQNLKQIPAHFIQEGSLVVVQGRPAVTEAKAILDYLEQYKAGPKWRPAYQVR